MYSTSLTLGLLAVNHVDSTALLVTVPAAISCGNIQPILIVNMLHHDMSMSTHNSTLYYLIGYNLSSTTLQIDPYSNQ